MLTLAIETSSPQASLAVARPGEILWHTTLDSDARHAAHLFAALEEACGRFGTFDRIVVGLGPGSYSGVRVAISAAIGLSIGMAAGMRGIPSIAALDTSDPIYHVAGDARRGDIFIARIAGRRMVEPPVLYPAGEAIERLGALRPVYITEATPRLSGFAVLHPSARVLTEIADRFPGDCILPPLEPLYLRAPHITHPKSVPGAIGEGRS